MCLGSLNSQSIYINRLPKIQAIYNYKLTELRVSGLHAAGLFDALGH